MISEKKRENSKNSKNSQKSFFFTIAGKHENFLGRQLELRSKIAHLSNMSTQHPIRHDDVILRAVMFRQRKSQTIEKERKKVFSENRISGYFLFWKGFNGYFYGLSCFLFFFFFFLSFPLTFTSFKTSRK